MRFTVVERSAGQTANHHRNIAARDRWWDQAKWAFDRLDTPITQASALEAFNELLDQAYDDAERAFVEAALRPGLSGTLTDDAAYEAQ